MTETILVLAAGASTRFGSMKQLALWQGRPLIRFVVEEALAVRGDVVVVVGAKTEDVKQALDGLTCRIVEAANWTAGPGASLKAGLEAIAQETSGVLVTLVDLPRVTRATFTRLLDAPGALVAASFSDTVGAPAVFRPPFLAQLRELDDATGAKALLQRHLTSVTRVPCPEAALDIDTREALAALDD
ncbi:MAG: nucleotidyltransferase family protein [Myxococcales bacterium]|nr:nucleotidyltransferase family protein [Myxococcales bacterium]